MIITETFIQKTIFIDISPSDFDFTRFGGTDEIKTTIKDSSLETIKEYVLSQPDENIHIVLNWRYFTVDGKRLERLYHLMTVAQVVNIFRRLFIDHILDDKELTYTLRMPYVYGAQQDKNVENQNQVSELYLIPLDIMYYETIMPHSTKPFSGVLCSNKPTKLWMERVLEKFDLNTTLFVFPDKSAKARTLRDDYKYSVVFSKTRDIESGELYGTPSIVSKVDYKDVVFTNVVFIDDLIMGGKTFIDSLAILKEQYHDIFKNNIKTTIAAPQVIPTIFQKVFAYFDEVITMDYNQEIMHAPILMTPGRIEPKITYIRWENIYGSAGEDGVSSVDFPFLNNMYHDDLEPMTYKEKQKLWSGNGSTSLEWCERCDKRRQCQDLLEGEWTCYNCFMTECEVYREEGDV